MRLARRIAQTAATLTRAEKAAILLAADVASVPLSLAAALWIQFGLAGFRSAADAALPVLPLLAAAAVAAALATGAAFLRLRDVREFAALRQTALVAVLVAGAAAIALDDRFGAGFHVVHAMTLFLVMSFARVAMHEALTALYRRGRPATRVLIYGAGRTGGQLARMLRHADGVETVGFLDDNRAFHRTRAAGLRVFPPDRAAELARDHDVTRVILAIPSLPARRRQEIAARMAALGIEVQAPPSFAQFVGEGVTLDRLVRIDPGRFLTRAALDCDARTEGDGYRGRSVLVTGAGGSIGSELCRQVLALGPRRLVLFELSEYALFQAERDLRAASPEGCEIVPVLGSVTDAGLVRSVLRRHAVETVLHAAAYKHVPLVEGNALAGLANNVLGTHALAREAEAAGVGRFILISSDKAVEPRSVMGATKRLAELVVQDHAARGSRTLFAAVRFGNVLGSSGSVIPVFREQIARGGPVTITHPDATRFFMTVEEAVHLVLVAGARARGGEVFALDMGEPVRIADIARKMIADAGLSLRDAANPAGDIAIEVIGLRAGEKVHEARMTEGAVPSGVHPAILVAEPPRLSQFELATALKAIRDAMAAGDWQDVPPAIERMMTRELAGERASAPRSSAP